jgi:uncharacterized Zn finger protein (UPF0148 family)
VTCTCPTCGHVHQRVEQEAEDPHAELRQRLIDAGIPITEDRVMLKAVARWADVPYERLKHLRRGCGGQRGRPVHLTEVVTLLTLLSAFQ